MDGSRPVTYTLLGEVGTTAVDDSTDLNVGVGVDAQEDALGVGDEHVDDDHLLELVDSGTQRAGLGVD